MAISVSTDAPDRVLVVDDDVAMRETLCLACEEEGFEALAAGSAADALGAARTGSLAAVLLDVHLPDGDGFHVLEALRALELHVATPVILITGHTQGGWAERALSLHATDYLTKPFHLDDLVLRLKLVTRVRRSQDALVRRALERSLAEARTKHEAIFRQSAEAVLVLEGDAVVDANPAAERIFGRARAALVGATLAGLSPAVQVEGQRTEAVLARLRASAEPVLWCVRRPDGALVQLEAVVRELALEGAPGARLLTARDVTRQRALEADLARSQRLEAINLLASGVAHDFNNVLTVISGYVDLALARSLSLADDKLALDLQEIRKGAERAAALTRQLLDFGRPRSGAKVPVSVDHLVERCHGLLARFLPEGVRFELRLRAPHARVSADPSSLERALMNLVVNARDAMPSGGEVVIATESVIVSPRDAEREKLAPGSYVLLSVRDTGAGMTDSVKAHAFDLFFSTKPRGEGTGLGLSIVHSIVEDHGGRVTVESHPGAGTTFWVYLPVSVPAEATTPTPGPFRKGTELVLLAEDDAMARGVEVAMLESFGHRVIACATGAEATAAFLEHRDEVALVVSDAVMPDEIGADLEQKLRALRPDVKFLLMTGQPAGIEPRPGAHTLWIEKPVTLHALSAALRRLLG